MKDEFRFRLNGIIIPEIRIQRAMIAGQPVGDLQIAVRDEEILGWFTIDGNENLWDKDLPRFILEYRNETDWQQKGLVEKRADRQKGWRTVSPRNLLKVLQAAGYINVDECRGV
jgi:hypothetical protein